ncbi:MAG: hypothetical protein HFF53_03240 [Lawsonibacter sp.]|nr:hypothetical protein [Lawsonibacter sp.]
MMQKKKVMFFADGETIAEVQQKNGIRKTFPAPQAFPRQKAEKSGGTDGVCHPKFSKTDGCRTRSGGAGNGGIPPHG